MRTFTYEGEGSDDTQLVHGEVYVVRANGAPDKDGKLREAKGIKFAEYRAVRTGTLFAMRPIDPQCREYFLPQYMDFADAGATADDINRTLKVVTIRNINDTPAELYNQHGDHVGTITNILQLQDVRIQIRELNVPGYTIKWDDRVIEINKHGFLDEWPEGFFDINDKQLDKLISL